jgi:hypothetical protein
MIVSPCVWCVMFSMIVLYHKKNILQGLKYNFSRRAPRLGGLPVWAGGVGYVTTRTITLWLGSASVG